MKMMRIALLHQAAKPPVVNGIAKPMKPGGYKDGGADIAHALSSKKSKWQVITPASTPNPTVDSDWSFPDTEAGILQAINSGANVLWANTILFSNHPITPLAIKHGISVVGQDAEQVQLYDDKDYANRLLLKAGLSLPASFLISEHKSNASADRVFYLDELDAETVANNGVDFPVVAKPIRGRGSQGVKKINTFDELVAYAKEMFSSKDYGNQIMVEEFLSGSEFTVSVFPPGKYEFNGKEETKANYWAAPPVIRVNHHDGIAPYNGVVAVSQNSSVWKEGVGNVNKEAVEAMQHECEVAAKVVDARAPIRIDCRMNKHGFVIYEKS